MVKDWNSIVFIVNSSCIGSNSKDCFFIKVSLLSALSCNLFEVNDFTLVSSSPPLKKLTPGIHVLAN